jgi:hypothetical protein
LVDVIELSQPFIEGRGEKFCRGCLGGELFSAIDLGDLPIANELLQFQESVTEKFPLHLRICTQCGLGQVVDVVTPERIFRDYRYLSSMSTTFLDHASGFVKQCLAEELISQGDWVLEIASNDGYLLKSFIPFGITTVGVEPARNVAEISRGMGIDTITEFFSSDLARKILTDRGFPKLIIANNVMAHVPDLIDFVQGLEILTGPDTLVSIENPSLENILIGMQFDSIYHEHYSYLSASSMGYISRSNGLQLFKVDELSIHGGSNRYWLRRIDSGLLTETSVDVLINKEIENGLFSQHAWANYNTKIKAIMNDFCAWLELSNKNGNRVFGYGAAAKASTLLNAIGIESDLIKAIADISLEKQKRFLPSYGIKIISPQELFDSKPTDILIFPWNIKNEISNYLRANCDNDVRLWCAIPKMHQVNCNE